MSRKGYVNDELGTGHPEDQYSPSTKTNRKGADQFAREVRELERDKHAVENS